MAEEGLIGSLFALSDPTRNEVCTRHRVERRIDLTTDSYGKQFTSQTILPSKEKNTLCESGFALKNRGQEDEIEREGGG